jgi:Na+-translocating ferredoxin:NAD+ oxidoreductase RnfD subunit
VNDSPVPAANQSTPTHSRGEAPLLRAPEHIRTIFTVMTVAACAPLTAGLVLFGWRAALVAAVAVFSCVVTERLYFRVTHTPSLIGRGHAYLTGVLLALTLPPLTPLWLTALAGVFAILLGKAVFGGVGHFLWQPALVGRFALAVMAPILVGSAGNLAPDTWPVLAPGHVLLGDIHNTPPTSQDQAYSPWRDTDLPDPPPGEVDYDAYRRARPARILAHLTRGPATFSALADIREEIPRREPTALTQLPPMADMLWGTYPGGIGETCAIGILLAGVYLIYRNFVKWELPVAFLLAGAAVAAVAPVQFARPEGTTEVVPWPIFIEGFNTGATYVAYQLLSGGFLLAAFFLAPEMTSRPVTGGGQVIFGLGAGATAMALQLYLDTPIPAYIAVLIWNTFTPTIDLIWRPRVLGQRHFSLFRKS